MLACLRGALCAYKCARAPPRCRELTRRAVCCRAALEAGTYKPKLVPDPNEINAPSRDEVAGFKAPDGVVWGDDDQKSFTTWDYAGPYGFQNEAVKMLEKNKELEGGVQTGGGGGCCTIA